MVNRTLWLLFGAFALLVGCASAPENARLESSAAAMPFDATRYSDFADYVSQTRESLEQNKVYFNPENVAAELDVAAPFELRPASSCPIGEPQKGILLIHGLSDMPFAMRDLSEAFAERCFLVRSLLLPGHGTRAGDLLDVSRVDWLNAVRFGVETLRIDTDEVYVGGFSLGGLLATLVAIEDPDIRGVFAFSPAMSLQRAWQLRLSVWLRHLVDWVDTDDPDDFARYEAMPVNGLAETYLLTRDLKKQLKQQSADVPLFLAQSLDDAIIDAVANSDFFEKRFSSPLSRSVVYVQKPSAQSSTDPRVKHVNSYLPEQRIVGFSHQSVHVAPTNMHYGAVGEYRNCGINSGRSETEVAQCMNADEVWYTETVGKASPNLPEGVVPARLTFNPLFEQLLDDIDAFLAGLTEETA